MERWIRLLAGLDDSEDNADGKLTAGGMMGLGIVIQSGAFIPENTKKAFYLYGIRIIFK